MSDHNAEAAEEPGESEELVLTPGGYRPKSLVHVIAPGNSLRETDKGLQEIDPAGNVVADFGPISEGSSDAPFPLGAALVAPASTPVAGVTPAIGTDDWIAYASWTNRSGEPVSFFQSTWTVPAAPSTHSGQTIYLWNGMTVPGVKLLQPVLQWGSDSFGGGNSWAVGSWLVRADSLVLLYSGLTSVAVGDVLVGTITLTRHTGSSFTYRWEFQGIASTILHFQTFREFTRALHTLEAYDLTWCSDYPASSPTSFRSIEILTGAVHPSLNWTPTLVFTDCRQSVTVNNANPGGQIDIFY
jgi:hypothetical protein